MRMIKERRAEEEEKMISKLQNEEKVIKELVEKLSNFESIKEDKDQYEEKLGRLYDIGLIDADGNPLVNKDDRSEDKELLRF